MKEFEKVGAAYTNAQNVANAFIKTQMLPYDELVFDKSVPPMKIGGKEKRLVSLRWNDEDELVLTCKGKTATEEMAVADLSVEEAYHFSEVMDKIDKEEA